jgi:hypothetical protein
MKPFLPLLTLAFFVCLSFNSNAANRFWVATTASNWNNISNWSNVPGGAGGFSVPTGADNVTFSNLRVGNCTIDIPGNVLSFTIMPGYTGTIFQGANIISVTNNASLSGGVFIGGTANITVGGKFTLNGTTVTSTSGILEFDGDATFTSGTFAHNNGTVRFSATGGTTTIAGTSPAFYNLELKGNGFNYNITSTGNIIVSNNLNLTGSLSYNINTGTIDVRGNINVTNTAIGCAGSGLVNINGTGIQNFNGSTAAGQGALPRVTINKVSGSLNLFNFPASSNNFVYTAGTVNSGTSTYCFTDGTATPYTISGSLTLNNIEFTALTNQTFTIPVTTTITANGNLTMAGTNRITINTGNLNISGNITLANTAGGGGGTAVMNIIGAGNETIDGTAIAVSQNLLPRININKPAGTLTLKGIISASRNWTYTSGIVDAGSFSSTVAFGGNALSVASAGMSFYNLRVVAHTITLTNNLSVNNNITISAGRLAPAGNTINIKGNWNNYGTGGFTEATSTVSFTGSSLQTITSPGGENFTNLTVNNSGTGIQLNNNSTVATTFNMTQGNMNLNGNTLTLGLSVANNGTLSYTNGTLFGLGTFTRWFKTGIIPGGSVIGLFPMGTASDYRPFLISAPAAGPTTGGTISVSYNNATTNTTIPTYMDGAATIQVRKDLNWAVTTGNGLNGGIYNLGVRGTGFGLIGAVSDLRLTLANSVVGSPGVNAGTTTNPQINRTGLTRANLVNSFYVGSINAVNTPLPITLISFTASVINGEVILKWSTSAEINNDYFTIQRSKADFGWENIQKIPGSGTSGSVKYYSTHDPSPLQGVSYYRLLQTDIDGRQSYSYVVSVNLGNKSSEISIYPNPANDHIKIRLPLSGKYVIALLSSSGQSLINPVTINGTGTDLNVSVLKSGIYFIQITHDGINETRKIIINK